MFDFPKNVCSDWAENLCGRSQDLDLSFFLSRARNARPLGLPFTRFARRLLAIFLESFRYFLFNPVHCKLFEAFGVGQNVQGRAKRTSGQGHRPKSFKKLTTHRVKQKYRKLSKLEKKNIKK